MNENIMAKINKYSDAYAQSLWERFTTLKTFSPKEVDSFQEFYRTLSAFPGMSVPENLSTLFSSEILDALPMSFLKSFMYAKETLSIGWMTLRLS